jgi:hypothetical protein
MKTLLLVFGMVGSATAWAWNPAMDHADAVVRFRSALCGDGSGGIQGSAVLLKTPDGSTYALTSESLVVPGRGACHSVQEGASPAVQALLVHADWASGLALLKFPAQLPSGRPVALDDFLDQAPQTGIQAVNFGYTLANQFYMDPTANVLLGRSDRHHLLNVARATELNNTHIEAGMVGGGSFASSDGKFIGVISHQYLKMRTGSATRPFTWDRVAGHFESRAILIPAAFAAEWVRSVLLGQQAADPIARVRAEDRLSGKDRVRVGGLELEAFCPQSGTPGSGGGSPIGGGDGTGIGGGDGTGIGGDTPDDPACRIVMTEDLVGGTSGQLPSGTEEAWPKLMANLKAGRRAKFIYFASRDDLSGGLSAVAVRSTAEMLKVIAKGLWSPIVAYDPLPTPTSPISEAEAKFQDIFHHLSFFGGCVLTRNTVFVRNVLRSDFNGLLQQRDIDMLTDLNGIGQPCWTMVALSDEHRPPTVQPPKLLPYLLGRYAEIKALLPPGVVH